ncbi:MAG: hypothetical protein KGL53_01095, partial [Elusimicrobia bacterium]|nr:hypothetical protein [Elusimicrobiota bacterium]
MAAWLLLALLLAPARAAVDSPEDWHCPRGKETYYWRGSLKVAPAAGPQWGDPLGDEAPTPFVWLDIYAARDHDLGERRAPIAQRWGEFSTERKCAYLDHFAEDARRRKEEYDELAAWKDDGRLVRRLEKAAAEDPVAAQDKAAAARLRERFEAMLSWLRSLGLTDADSQRERAYGVLIKTGLLAAAYQDFLVTSGHYRALAQTRLAAALADP